MRNDGWGDVAEAQEEAGADWFDPQTRTLFAAICGIVGAIAALFLWNAPEADGQGGLTLTAIVQSGVFCASLLTAQMLRLSAVWQRYSKALRTPSRERNESERQRVEHGFIEFFVYLAASLGGLSFVAYSASSGGAFEPLPVRITGDDMNVLHLAGFLLVFACAFAPLILGFGRQARLEAELRGEGQSAPILRDDVVSELSFWTTATLVAGLVVLAWAAAGGMFVMKEDFGVFITFVVLLVFFVIILSPHVLRVLNNWLERKEIDHAALAKVRANGAVALTPGVLMSRLDSILVRFVAPLSGATQHGPVWFTPHLLVLVVILPLSALGFVLSAPWGLVPIGVAVLIAVALGRRWAWVEEDRETASRLRTTRGREIAIGFDNDLKDEALLGYASLFILVPLALHQLQGWTHSFAFDETISSDNAFIDWLRFFGAELAKAVPFVDWWEIYNVDIQTPYDATLSDNALAKHLTFAARAMVDLVIMAALFQAIGLWQRSRTHNRLYDTGQLDIFDPFTEINFFERGMYGGPEVKDIKPKSRFVNRVDAHVGSRRQLGLVATPYSADRLSELMHSPHAEVKAGALWMIDKYKVLAGTPAEQLDQMLDRLRSDKFKRAVLSKRDEEQFYVREQRAQLERVLLELEQRPDLFRDPQVKSLVAILVEVRELPEFTSAETTAVTLFERQFSRCSLLALYNLVLEPEHRTSEAGSALDAAIRSEFGTNADLYTGLAPMRFHIYSAIETHGLREPVENRRNEIAKFLDWMAQESDSLYGVRGDRAQSSRNRAAEAAQLVKFGFRKRDSDDGE